MVKQNLKPPPKSLRSKTIDRWELDELECPKDQEFLIRIIKKM